MLVQLKYLSETVIFTKFKIKKSLLCCLEKFASQNANFLQFIISVLYIFSIKIFTIITCPPSSSSSAFQFGLCTHCTDSTLSWRFHSGKRPSLPQLFLSNTAGAFYDSGIGACWEKYVLEMLGEMFLTSWRVREFEGDAFCATCTLQKDCREGHLSSFPGHRSSPHFGSFSSLKSCLHSPGLPHSCRSKHSPSGFLGKLF